jgi:hypothetical protein
MSDVDGAAGPSASDPEISAEPRRSVGKVVVITSAAAVVLLVAMVVASRVVNGTRVSMRSTAPSTTTSSAVPDLVQTTTVTAAPPPMVSTTSATTLRTIAPTTTAPSASFGVEPGVVPPGHHVTDPCLGPTATPIAVAGTRSPDGRLWIALQHGSIGTSDDRATTWQWHCQVIRSGGSTIAPKGIISWDATHALTWGQSVGGVTVMLTTADAGATWADVTPAGAQGADIASAATVVAWGARSDASGTPKPVLYRLVTASGEWHPIDPTGMATAPRAVAFTDDDHGWAFGPSPSSSDRTWLAATSDGGDTWTPLTPPSDDEIVAVAAADTTHGCLLRRAGRDCTRDGGGSWTSGAFDVRITHLGAVDATRSIAAGPMGQIRFLTDGAVLGGETIDYDATNQIRFLSIEWGRYITTNSWDGCFEIEDDRGALEVHALGPHVPANLPC